ncbi:hypothetical protein HDF19_10370 [Mucilaginibacter sp. E4BP6]|jgi:hypothetical protein|uniref:hypothetical protein n=1 Tax=Mucilaginibacter sp. E4BP6 TaxID=2723089 RepID=UPI0015C84902|nr:hypothetical protein [Mucilaginibacter sp. E4BP6]NYE65447.1 hypothetical protein [Mucilaginibacter sp. E4BP6]
MEYEYTTSTGYKIFYGIAAIALLGFTFFVALSAKDGFTKNHGTIILPIVGIIVSALITINLYKRKVTISDYSITYTNIWGSKEIINKDVKGYRILDKRITIYSIDGGKKVAVRDYLSISNLDELQRNLNEKYTNLDLVSYQNNLKAIADDSNLGNTEEERMSTFKKVKRIALVYNIGGIGMFILCLFFSEFILDNKIIKVFILLYPAFGIILLAFSKGLIKLVSSKSSAYGSLIAGMYASTIIGMIAMISHYDFVAYDNLWLPILMSGLIFTVILWKYGYDRSENAVKGQIIMLILIAFLYSIPLAMMVNCELDPSPEKIYVSKISNRYIFHNNGRAYYHVVIETSEYTLTSSKDLHISDDLYDKIQSLQAVHIAVKSGLLGAPWIYIKE